jgi:DeoR/GlpR family transcriptional regulator of sugar metabolism
MMAGEERLEQIVALVDAKGYVSVKELSVTLNVSEVTIRRDLQRLHEENRLRRTFGGGVSLRSPAPPDDQLPAAAALPEGSLVDRVDVLIASSLDPQSDHALVDQADRATVPIIAESTGASGMETVVAVDSYHAAVALGNWAGHYVRERFDGQANILDLTYRLSNTEARSQGFIAGIRQVVPTAQVVLSINALSRYETAYQMTLDALHVHPNINVIFAINDSMAGGAIRACQELKIDPEAVIVLPFGLEGDTLKNAMIAGPAGYCRAGLAMFPEIVGPVCIEAAIDAHNHKRLPTQLVTPHAVLTPETLTDYYTLGSAGWQIRWDTVNCNLAIPLDIHPNVSRQGVTLPKRIGFVVPFSEHEWYKNLALVMQAYADALGIEFETVDAAQNLRDDVMLRQRAIARLAAEQVQPGDVLLIDGSEVTTYLAEELLKKENITVITNSLPVFEVLRTQPAITLLSTGGSLRRASDTLIGPIAEAALRELRADKFFLAVTGISLGFGLSHTNVSEIAMKQAMLRSAREVILLADHTKFGQESVMQIAPVSVVHKLITDNALSASTRLELGKLGIQVIISKA